MRPLVRKYVDLGIFDSCLAKSDNIRKMCMSLCTLIEHDFDVKNRYAVELLACKFSNPRSEGSSRLILANSSAHFSRRRKHSQTFGLSDSMYDKFYEDLIRLRKANHEAGLVCGLEGKELNSMWLE